MNNPGVVNVADLLKNASSQNRLPKSVVIGGQTWPVVTQNNSVLLGGISSSTSATPPPTSQMNMNYSYKGKIINPATKE